MSHVPHVQRLGALEVVGGVRPQVLSSLEPCLEEDNELVKAFSRLFHRSWEADIQTPTSHSSQVGALILKILKESLLSIMTVIFF